LLSAALMSEDSNRAKATTATLAVVGVTALDIYSARQLSAAEVMKCITISKSAEELYQFCRNAENVSRFLNMDESVSLTQDRANDSIAWNSGRLQFQPSPRNGETVVQLYLHGMGANTLRAEQCLRRLKQLLETGEIASTEGQPTGTSKSAIFSKFIQGVEHGEKEATI
jgi:hypothetical protein